VAFTDPEWQDPEPDSTEPSEIVVEIHVPLVESPKTPGGYPFPWIDDVMDFLAELDGSRGEMYDDGEELGDEYLFFIAGAAEADLIDLAREIAHLPGVPDGGYAVVTTSDAEEMGVGRVTELTAD
jgi:hypothetical protein